jgi:hypothetical protein
MTRTAIFNILIGVIIGSVLAIGYAWSRPPKADDATLDLLRADYKTDTVVMIAQAYAVDSNLDLARSRLAALNVKNPAQHVADVTRQLIIKGAPPTDLRALVALTTALGGTPPALP